MRSLFILLVCASTQLTGACASSLPPVPTPTPTISTTVPGTIIGSIDGKPFHAWSALMTDVNRPAWMCTHVPGEDGCSTSNDHVGITHSTVTIFERGVSCADAPKNGDRIPRVPRERRVEFMVQGLWPLPANTVLATEVSDSRRDHIDIAYVSHVVTEGPSAGDQEGSGVEGKVVIVEATPTGGLIWIDLSNDSEDRIKGTIPIVACS